MERHLDGILEEFNNVYASLTSLTQNISPKDLHKDFSSALAGSFDPYPLLPMDPISVAKEFHVDDYDEDNDDGNAEEKGYSAGDRSPPFASPAYSSLQLTIMINVSWFLERQSFFQVVERGEGDCLSRIQREH